MSFLWQPFGEGAATGPQTVTANLLTVTASLPNATVSAGGVSVSANLLTVTASLPNATVTNVLTVSANLLTVSASLPNATITPGGVSVTANLLTVSVSLPSATILGTFTWENGLAGTNGVTPTGGSGGNTTTDGRYIDTVNGSGAGDSITYDSSMSHSGSTSVHMVSTTSGNEYLEWSLSPTVTSTLWVRMYWRYTATAASGADKIIRVQDSTGITGEIAFFRYDLNPNPGIGDSAGTFTEPSGPPVLSASTWYRIEMEIPIGNSVTITGRMFTGANLEGSTADIEWTQATSDTDLGNSNIGFVRFGNSVAGPVNNFDDIAVSTVGWIGARIVSGDQTVTANLLTVSASLPNATVTTQNTVVANILSPTGTLHNATVTAQNSIVANLLTVSASLPNATITVGGVTVTANLLTPSASLPNATITTGNVNVVANLLSVTASLPGATVTAAATVAANLLSATASLPSATVTPGGVSVVANLLSITASLPNATVAGDAPGAQTITGNLLSVTATLANATITTGNVNVTANLLSPATTLPSATITTGNVNVVANLLTVTANLPNATFTTQSSIVANLLSPSKSLPNATITTQYTITANLLSPSKTLPNATITASGVSIAANVLTVTASLPNATITGGVATIILQNNVNVGTDETQLTGGSGGNTVGGGNYFDTIGGNTGAAPADRVVYSATQKAHGTYSMLADSDTSGGEYAEWNTQWTDETIQVDVRFYFRVITFPASAANKICRMFDNLGNEVAFFRVDTAPNPGIGDSAGTFTEPSGPVVLTANTWYRCEMHVPIGNSVTITCNLFAGGNMDGTTPDYSWTQAASDTLTAGGDIASIRFGNSIAGVSTYFDDIGIRNDGVAFGAATDAASITANLFQPPVTFPQATVVAGGVSFTAQRLLVTASLPNATISQITQISTNLLTVTASLPNATLSITGAQTIAGDLLTVPWQAFPATITLGTLNIPGSILGSVGRRIIVVGTATERKDIAGAVTKG